MLLLATAIPLVLLMVQSLGDIPSEPLGGGPARELVLGIGRPLILFLVAVGIMIIGEPRQAQAFCRFRLDHGVLGSVAGILLIVCAAGGLQGSARRPAWPSCSASACSPGTPARLAC